LKNSPSWQCQEQRDSSTAQADAFAGANAKEKTSACSARNDKYGALKTKTANNASLTLAFGGETRIHMKMASMVYHVYIMASESGVLYIGVTNHLESRTAQHKLKVNAGFTSKYNVTKLLYFEPFTDVRYAIAREKQLKRWRREKKVALIERINPTWRDLSLDFHQ